jgi:hypothetical protein
MNIGEVMWLLKTIETKHGDLEVKIYSGTNSDIYAVSDIYVTQDLEDKSAVSVIIQG